ncbi:hypothetical protein Pav013_2220 [Pseudomonas syringae pv. avellanae str. ISPaVe013]|uniref:hypothetical protein n=1 Tax=Pseudomonas syringae TaxID=317 RepID=UPI00028CBBF6|nr:hypothetical protein [Pseudomonas syringae]EKG40710.1 hypothetical protein Pav013_2220 [Pseudomonas syringae pv. avellanae str. ISPaVe013]
MLACYPIAATHENWLHDSLVLIIQDIHAALDSGEVIPETQVKWRNLVPLDLTPVQRDGLANSKGIRNYSFAYMNSVATLTSLERQRIFSILQTQNCIPELLSGAGEIETIETDYPAVHEVVKLLFIFSFEKLTDFKVRERQYQIIFRSLKTKICPFCGIERVMNPEETAQDQDHYLAKSIYPFAAVNMRNLVPMCRCCNRDYKKAVDVIRDERGLRRTAFDPYNCVMPTISLLQSSIDMETSPPLPRWNVEFIPASDHAETWDSVFGIRTRYKRDILNEYFDTWLRGFSSKCAKDRRRKYILPDFSCAEIRTVLADYTEDKTGVPSVGMAGFLEPLVFEFLLSQYDQGNDRIIKLVRDLVLGMEMEIAA